MNRAIKQIELRAAGMESEIQGLREAHSEVLDQLKRVVRKAHEVHLDATEFRIILADSEYLIRRFDPDFRAVDLQESPVSDKS